MEVYRISAVTLFVTDMKRSCGFYSKIPGFSMIYGGPADPFTTFEIGKSDNMLNLQLESSSKENGKGNFGRIIFYAEDVDKLYSYFRDDKDMSQLISFEKEPADAPWGERFFHVQDPDGYQLSFAKPIRKA